MTATGAPQHVEQHFMAGDLVRDVVIGMSDGLTVPFALAAGLTGAIAASRLVVTAGLAEVAAGSIAMGLGGYLAARGDVEHYVSERKREEREVVELPEREAQEVDDVLQQWGLTPQESGVVVGALRRRPKAWVDFMMRFELGLEEPDPGRALRSAGTIAGAYVAGGLVPLFPYMMIAHAHEAAWYSVAVTVVALLLFGYVKGKFTGAVPLRSAIQTAAIGSVAAAAAFFIARLVGGGA